MSADVATPNAAYREMAADWELIHDLLGGTRIMRQRGEKWLPREPGESREAYAIRLGRSVLFNGLQRTVQTLVGKPFHRPAELAGSPASGMLALAEDVDLGGRNLTIFARDVLQAALTDGLTHILVDHPRLGEGEEPGGTPRPYLVHIPAPDLIGWRGQENGIGSRLSRIRIRERVNRSAGAWEDRTRRQVRVLYPGRFEIWRRAGEESDGPWRRAETGECSLDCIPLVTIYANRTGFMTARPPLMDLAWLNLAHWQSASDQRHILHVARVPILFGRNLALPEDGLELGPNRIVTGDGDGADLRFVEHSGAAIAAGRQDLIDLEDRMAVMGLDLMTRRAGAGSTTATARAIDAAENSTALLSLVRAVEDGLTVAFSYMADWLDIPRSASGRVELHQRDAADLDPVKKG
ncbi:DUF4055 domain-containing protein [Nisaea acidiphila]|uniref:DUF4055 domain-containing protein n=1 Tax=Nisaea acidiphila TaxID=1862145 RepID=A0A9J7B2A7_9PROT|nr:DUF4055 domain-containing protein [Nisaea acidiphila]UUX51797.1 DUF4055 domain-containing protein [Nisaea acidiphila]